MYMDQSDCEQWCSNVDLYTFGLEYQSKNLCCGFTKYRSDKTGICSLYMNSQLRTFNDPYGQSMSYAKVFKSNDVLFEKNLPKWVPVGFIL